MTSWVFAACPGGDSRHARVDDRLAMTAVPSPPGQMQFIPMVTRSSCREAASRAKLPDRQQRKTWVASRDILIKQK